MSWYSKVFWSEGLFLRPQHLQQNDRYVEHLIERRTRHVTPYPWGFEALEIDQDLAQQSKFAVRRAAGWIKAGAPKDIAHSVALMRPLTVAETLTDLAAGSSWSLEAVARVYHHIGGLFGFDKLREHLHPTYRAHRAITAGGIQPNIIADTGRLSEISSRLRDFARAENPVALGAAKLSASIAGLRSSFPALDIRASGELDTPMRISEENAAIILSNLADNAVRHGSTTLDLAATRQGHHRPIRSRPRLRE